MRGDKGERDDAGAKVWRNHAFLPHDQRGGRHLGNTREFTMEGCQKPKLSVSGQARCCSEGMDTRISEEVRFKARQAGVSVRPIAHMQML